VKKKFLVLQIAFLRCQYRKNFRGSIYNGKWKRKDFLEEEDDGDDPLIPTIGIRGINIEIAVTKIFCSFCC
jgi:hypothetical protein